MAQWLSDADFVIRPAQHHTESWIPAFKRRVDDSRRVPLNESDKRKNSEVWEPNVYSLDKCISVMMEATSERRDRALAFLDSHPDNAAYTNLMGALIASEKAGNDKALNNVIAFHDVLIQLLNRGDKDAVTSDIAIKLPYDVARLSAKEFRVRRAALMVTAYCTGHDAGIKYLDQSSSQPNDFALPHYTSHILLREEILAVVKRNPESVDRVIDAIEASGVRLTDTQLQAVIDGELPISLLDGML